MKGDSSVDAEIVVNILKRDDSSVIEDNKYHLLRTRSGLWYNSGTQYELMLSQNDYFRRNKSTTAI